MPSTLFDIKPTAPDIKATAAKRQRLEQLETIIKDSYYRQGEAFKEIRDARLYLLDYESFDAYCKSQWNHNRAWADRLISAAKVAGNIKQVDPNGSIPRNESQARSLTKLNPEAQRAAFAEVENSSNKITARELEKFAQRYKDLSPTVTPIETSREKLFYFQEMCMELAQAKKDDAYIRDCLDEMWIKVSNLSETLEVSLIKLQLKMLFYYLESLAAQTEIIETSLRHNPWGFEFD